VAFLTTDARGALVGSDPPEPVFGTAPAALLDGFSRLPEVEIHVLSCVQTAVRSPPTLFGQIHFHSLLVPKMGWLRTGFLGCIRAVRRQIRTLQPHLVHGQGTERDCAISAVFSGRPNLLTIHGNMRRIARLSGARPFSYPWIMARLERLVLPRTDGVICITRHTVGEVSALARRTWVVPNPVDGSFFSVRRRPLSPPTAVCIGTVSVIKNQNNLIRALDPVARYHRFGLEFYGAVQAGEAWGEEFRRLIRERPWCQHRGFASREALKEILAQATLLILPSIEENCPMVILEAMAAGVPVVAARVGGVPELVEDGVTGRLFDPRDPASMATAVGQALADPTRTEAMAVAAQRQARQRFEPEVVARRHVEIYRQLLESRR
jgi:glycosyltransferase involved in cell wall biosynthesis